MTTLTTVGYGDIHPVNTAERSFTLFTELMAVLIFGYLLNTVTTLIESIDPNAVEIQSKITQVKVYLRWHRFPPDLSKRVKRYFEFYYSRKSAMDEEEIVGLLAPTLRRRVLSHLVGRSVMLIPLFNENQAGYVTLDLQIAIMDSLRPLMREPKEPIMEGLIKGAVPSASIYFLRRGAVGAMASLKDVCFYEISSATPDGAGAIIGENALMSKGRSISTYTASSRCELYALGVNELHKIVNRYLNMEEIDQMAEMVYDVFAKRHMIRAMALRISQLNMDNTLQSDPGEAVVTRLQRSAALRLRKSEWLSNTALWMDRPAHLDSCLEQIFAEQASHCPRVPQR